jgi:ribosomal protein S16
LLVEVLLDPQAKITSRKQAARLIGTLRQPDAVDALSALGSAPVDVRIAAGSALRSFLDDDRAWYVLADLAVSGRDAELSLIQVRPEQVAVRHRPRYAQVLALAASGGDAGPIGLLGAWTPWSARLSEHLAALVSSPDLLISKGACVAVEVAAGLSMDWTPYRTAVATLVAAAVSDDEPHAELATDLPSWQRLGRLVDALIPARAGEAAYHRDHLLELAHLFDEHPGLVEYSWRLRVAAIDWSAPEQAVLDLANQVDPLRASEVATLVESTLRRVSDQGHDPHLTSIIDELTARGDATGGALALALTVFAGTRSGWTPARRDQLVALRSHPVAAVAAWAHQHVTVVS